MFAVSRLMSAHRPCSAQSVTFTDDEKLFHNQRIVVEGREVARLRAWL